MKDKKKLVRLVASMNKTNSEQKKKENKKQDQEGKYVLAASQLYVFSLNNLGKTT